MKRATKLWIIGIVVIVLLVIVIVWNFGLNVYDVDVPITAKPSDCYETVRFAVIGDFGDAGEGAASVAAMVDSWNVDFIVTTGDNNYPDGEASTIDENIGQYYHAYMAPV